MEVVDDKNILFVTYIEYDLRYFNFGASLTLVLYIIYFIWDVLFCFFRHKKDLNINEG